MKVQAAGPWTLAASVELHTGHRVLTDRGAVREFAASLREGLRAHVAEVAERTGARVLVQLDEPWLPAVLAGTLPTASGWGTVRSVSAPAAQDLLRELVTGLGAPVVLHCCADRTPRCGCWPRSARPASGSTPRCPSVAGDTAVPAALDALGEVWDAGTPLLLGLVPSLPPRRAESPADAPVDGDGPVTPPALKSRPPRLRPRRPPRLRPRAPGGAGRPHPDLRPRRGHTRLGAPGHGAVP